MTRDEHRIRWIALIKEFEGFPFGGRPYFGKLGGVWTIGYGHTEGVGPHSPRLTERQASELLERDLEKRYEGAVEALPTAHLLNQNQFDALVVFVYNVGGGALAADTGIGKALRARQWHRAADEMLRWDRAQGMAVVAGLTRRRRAERELFLAAATAHPLAALTGASGAVPRVRPAGRAKHAGGTPRPPAAARRPAPRDDPSPQGDLARRPAAAGGWEVANRRIRYRALRGSYDLEPAEGGADLRVARLRLGVSPVPARAVVDRERRLVVVLDLIDVEAHVGDALALLDHGRGRVGGDRDARAEDRQRAAGLVAQAGERVAPVGEREVDGGPRRCGSRWRRDGVRAGQWRAPRRCPPASQAASGAVTPCLRRYSR